MNFTIEEKFNSKIKKQVDGCWIWTGRIGKVGYGTFTENGKQVYVHRWSFAHFKGPIPERFQIDHLCREKRCVNPDHLEAVTQRENLLRGQGQPARNARKIVCKRGHDNWKIKAKGRECRTCEALQRSLYLWKKNLEKAKRKVAGLEKALGV